MDPNADNDTDEARGFMNAIVNRPIGALAALIVVAMLLVWFVTTR